MKYAKTGWKIFLKMNTDHENKGMGNSQRLGNQGVKQSISRFFLLPGKLLPSTQDWLFKILKIVLRILKSCCELFSVCNRGS